MSRSETKNEDAALLAALAAGKSVDECAKATGVSRATAYRRLDDPAFKAELDRLKRDILDRTMAQLSEAGLEAVKTLRSLMSHGKESARLDAGKAPDTVNRELTTLKHLFTKAVEWGELESSVAHKVKPLKRPPGRLRYLTLEKGKTLLAECRASSSPHLYAVVLTAMHTGARRGELLSMTWEQVDSTNRAIKIIGTKNGTVRVVPMTNEVKECLSSLPHHIKAGLVFFNKSGKEYLDFKKGFHAAMKRAGIEGFRFHDLRHTYASWLAINGVDILTIKELLGHKEIKMTLRYAHLSPWNLKRAGGVLNAYWQGQSEEGHQESASEAG
ncbi:MAG: tyrosine-type recombinase/integrase [Nitrospirae bacterium]|nr:tyrosine-type recombinase/integrase [Nitrospirota bacterium]